MTEHVIDGVFWLQMQGVAERVPASGRPCLICNRLFTEGDVRCISA